jgi:hypothetical protein
MPNKKKTMTKLLLNFTEKETRLLREESEKTGLSVSEIVRRIIDSSYLNPNKNGNN